MLTLPCSSSAQSRQLEKCAHPTALSPPPPAAHAAVLVQHGVLLRLLKAQDELRPLDLPAVAGACGLGAVGDRIWDLGRRRWGEKGKAPLAWWRAGPARGRAHARGTW